MPLPRFVLLLVLVVAAAAATVMLGALLASILNAPLLGLALAVPPLLVGLVLIRVVLERLNNREDDRYDRTRR